MKRQDRDAALRYFRLGERRVQEMPEPIARDLPPGKGREFWLRTFEQQITVASAPAVRKGTD